MSGETVLNLLVTHTGIGTVRQAAPYPQFKLHLVGKYQNCFNGDICSRNDGDGIWLRARDRWCGPFPGVSAALVAWALLT